MPAPNAHYSLCHLTGLLHMHILTLPTFCQVRLSSVCFGAISWMVLPCRSHFMNGLVQLITWWVALAVQIIYIYIYIYICKHMYICGNYTLYIIHVYIYIYIYIKIYRLYLYKYIYIYIYICLESWSCAQPKCLVFTASGFQIQPSTAIGPNHQENHEIKYKLNLGTCLKYYHILAYISYTVSYYHILAYIIDTRLYYHILTYIIYASLYYHILSYIIVLVYIII